MNKFICALSLASLCICTACTTPKRDTKIKEMDYVCSSLAQNYLKTVQLDTYTLWNKRQTASNKIQTLYVKHEENGQIVLNPSTKLFECKEEKNKYILSEIDQISLKKYVLISLRLST